MRSLIIILGFAFLLGSCNLSDDTKISGKWQLIEEHEHFDVWWIFKNDFIVKEITDYNIDSTACDTMRYSIENNTINIEGVLLEIEQERRTLTLYNQSIIFEFKK